MSTEIGYMTSPLPSELLHPLRSVSGKVEREGNKGLLCR